MVIGFVSIFCDGLFLFSYSCFSLVYFMFVYFSMPSLVFSLCFYGRSFLSSVVFSHWESPVLGYVNINSV